jgi:hypothetical protein
MITPKEILAKADKMFFKVTNATLNGETIFPLTIPANKTLSGKNYSDWKNDLVPLYEQSKQIKRRSYSVEWKEKTVNGSKQSVPAKIYFESLEDYLSFTSNDRKYKNLSEARTTLLKSLPRLKEWITHNLPDLLENFEYLEDIVKVCRYFLAHPPPHPFFIRELPIEIHTKFIEQNSRLLRQMLDILLPPGWINSSGKNFEERYYLKRIGVYTQIRILDEALKSHLGFDELALTIEDAGWLKWIPENVFIIENQICYHTFPKLKNSITIFGEGFKSRLSKHIGWLAKTKLYCWFDLDCAGFEMLNMIREHYPNARSFLMDKNSYEHYSSYSVDNKSRKKTLQYLTTDERLLYEFLQSNNKRLEQERIELQYVYEHLPLIL